MISGIYILCAIVGAAVIFLLVLRIRYNTLKSGSKDKKRIIQRIIKVDKSVPQEEAFLPGSRAGGSSHAYEDVMEQGLSVERLKPDKKRFSKLGTREEIKRAFLLDELLRRKVR
ncbi:MAG: hypothetical protein AAF824_11745 [Bacteroidota bacterium]